MSEGLNYHPENKLTERYAKIADWISFYKDQRECLSGLEIEYDDLPEYIREDKSEFYQYIREQLDKKKKGVKSKDDMPFDVAKMMRGK